MSLKAAFQITEDAVDHLSKDYATTQAAALSFYTALSLAPLLVILLYLVGAVSPGAQDQLVWQMHHLVGPEAGEIIAVIMDNASREMHTGTISMWIGIATLVLSATAVFAQLQTSLNRIWKVQPKPSKDKTGILRWLKKRLISLGMVVSIGFLSLVSLVASAAITLFFSGEGTLWQYADFLFSLAIYILVFGLMFKILPDVKIDWYDVRIGAVITAMLFVLGKFAIGKYLGYSTIGSTYGAAGSLVVLLVWVYYTSIIVFFGAEITVAIARHRERVILPEEHAEETDPYHQSDSPPPTNS